MLTWRNVGERVGMSLKVLWCGFALWQLTHCFDHQHPCETHAKHTSDALAVGLSGWKGGKDHE